MNGSLNGSANQSAGTPAAGTTNICIGNSSVGNNSFDGILSGVRIINGILTVAEIAQLWSSERGKYNV